MYTFKFLKLHLTARPISAGNTQPLQLQPLPQAPSSVHFLLGGTLGLPCLWLSLSQP